MRIGTLLPRGSLYHRSTWSIDPWAVLHLRVPLRGGHLVACGGLSRSGGSRPCITATVFPNVALMRSPITSWVFAARAAHLLMLYGVRASRLSVGQQGREEEGSNAEDGIVRKQGGRRRNAERRGGRPGPAGGAALRPPAATANCLCILEFYIHV